MKKTPEINAIDLKIEIVKDHAYIYQFNPRRSKSDIEWKYVSNFTIDLSTFMVTKNRWYNARSIHPTEFRNDLVKMQYIRVFDFYKKLIKQAPIDWGERHAQTLINIDFIITNAVYDQLRYGRQIVNARLVWDGFTAEEMTEFNRIYTEWHKRQKAGFFKY